MRIGRLVAVILTAMCLVSCSARTDQPDPSVSPSVPEVASPTARPSQSPESPTAAPMPTAWEQLCVVAPVNLPEASIRTAPPGEVWSDGALTIRREGGNLVAEQNAGSYEVFSGDIDDESGVAGDVFTGAIDGNDRWVLFMSADSLNWGDPWRLHVWDRQHPGTPARIIGQYTGKSSNPGFALQHLRGDQAVWSEPTTTNLHRIRHADLLSGSIRTLAEGPVYAARFIHDRTVAWQTQLDDQTVAVQVFDLETGQTSWPDNPIATMNSARGSFATDGEFWILANVPSGDDDDDETTYDLWLWRDGWPDKKLAASLVAPAYLSTGQPLSEGRLGITLQRQGAFVIDLREGIAQRVRDGWAVVEPDGATIHVAWGKAQGAKELKVSASLPASTVAQPGECIATLRG